MSLQRLLAENMLKLNIKNLNESTRNKLTDKLGANIRSDYYSDTTYYDRQGVLVENAFFLQEQTKMRRAMSAVRRAVQATPLMVKWQEWRTSKFIKKNGLPTQQELMAKDSEQVKATQGYQQVIYLLYSKRTMDPASIMFWNGAPALGGDANPADGNEMRKIINQLSRFNGITIPSSNEANPAVQVNLTAFLNAMKKLYEQGVYLTADDLTESLFDSKSGLALNAIMTLAIYNEYNGNRFQVTDAEFPQQFKDAFETETGRSLNYAMEVDLKRLENFATKLAIAAGGKEGRGRSNTGAVDSLATYEVGITDADKIKICQGVSTQLVTDKETYPNLKLEDYTDFVIGPEEVSVKSNIVVNKEKVGGDIVEVVGTYYSYPDNPNDPAQRDVIFGNNDNITEWQNTGPFVDSVKQRIDAIQKDGWKILRVEYHAGARSSKVGTTKYGGTTEAQKTQGNVKLCKERAATITAQLGPIFKQLLPDAGLMAGKAKLHANQGPGWYDYDPTEGRYGSLYESYRQKNPDTTPRDFYSARNNPTYYERIKAKGFQGAQAQVQAEYEQVYSPFRGTYAGYALYCYQENPVPTQPKVQPDIDIKTAGTWFFALEYNVVTGKDLKISMKSWFKSRWRKVKRAWKRIDLSKIKFQSLGEGMNLIDICDAYN